MDGAGFRTGTSSVHSARDRPGSCIGVKPSQQKQVLMHVSCPLPCCWFCGGRKMWLVPGAQAEPACSITSEQHCVTSLLPVGVL